MVGAVTGPAIIAVVETLTCKLQSSGFLREYPCWALIEQKKLENSYASSNLVPRLTPAFLYYRSGG